jgi:hypothetical protein
LATHQPGIGEKVSLVRETVDAVDLVEQHQSQNGTHAWDRLQEKVTMGILHFDGAFQLQFQVRDLLVQAVDHR